MAVHRVVWEGTNTKATSAQNAACLQAGRQAVSDLPPIRDRQMMDG